MKAARRRRREACALRKGAVPSLRRNLRLVRTMQRGVKHAHSCALAVGQVRLCDRVWNVAVSFFPFCTLSHASLAQLAEHALRKRMVVGSIPTGGFYA